MAWIKQEHKISQPATEHAAKHLSGQYGSHGMFDNNKIFLYIWNIPLNPLSKLSIKGTEYKSQCFSSLFNILAQGPLSKYDKLNILIKALGPKY